MFCNQCEQTSRGLACNIAGVCGKSEDVSSLQDALIYALQGIAPVALEARRVGIQDEELDTFVLGGIFSTLTNVDFDPERIAALVHETVQRRDDLMERLRERAGAADFDHPSVRFVPMEDWQALAEQGKQLQFIQKLDTDEDIRSLKQILLYGVKGIAAYGDHAAKLGQRDAAISGFVYEALAALGAENLTLEDCVQAALKAGEINLRAMEILDAGNTSRFGHPVPTSVPLGYRRNKCILITGHDLLNLETLLKQTEGKGIDVYTHGEMLPCHGYPELKKYPHFIGHFGTAWHNQRLEFGDFPGPILFTTNCIQKPGAHYADRVFTTGLVGWPGIKHVAEDDFSEVVEMALQMDGYTKDLDAGSVTVGFARNAVLGVADKVVEGVKSGAIKHFFLVGGCDGAKGGRDYYSEFVSKTPEDSVILTLACGKFRFFNQQLGDIGGIPRLLDIGQCNDAYSAIQIAVELSKAFDCEVNDLPLSMVLSWYEQKAVSILLTLLYLGIKDIRLGPSLPAFISPKVLDFLVENYGIKPITTPDQDLAELLAS
ncbi:hydroxylamine reductase [Pelagicoccus sp. SDUM812003]|uniref:hydroxylamine reductase n=1 Tax=Pelagicoccus sp. SDUM812003 TaxID=3041267 RepID=UPI00280CE66D|nr:hydroxylamine reductase [Pelagicoccus sp. SDUM812003]MDQ8202591.1 hydroxylamine reductase [Pelagicoccus sp. SDUM812003]